MKLAKRTADWPASNCELWPRDKLKPAARNARLHTKADVDAIAASMEKWGITVPILADDAGNIIAGHARLAAAQKLKLEKVPVIIAKGWTEEEKAAYCIADNQLAARATWDFPILTEELKRLGAAAFDLNLLGFDETTLSELLGPQDNLGVSDPDAELEPPENPISKLGDIWRLGRHSVGCGDCTIAAVVRELLGVGKAIPKLMATDPPYGVKYDATWRGKADGKKAGRSLGVVLNDDRADWREAWKLFDGDVAYVWHAGMFGGVVAESLISCGFELRSQIVWAKSHFTLGRGDYHWQHEACFYVVRKGSQRLWRGGRDQSTLWQVANNTAIGNRPREKAWGHSTQKPVELMRRPIENNSVRGDVVYDPFLGSGTTVIAAEMTGRTCVGLELNPSYVDVIVRRWMEFTGQDAIHHATGKRFAEMADEGEDD